MEKRSVIFTLFFVFLLMIFWESGVLIAQQQTVDKVVKQSAQSLGIQSFWQLTEKAGIFRWPLFGTFIIGIIIIVKKFIDLVLDRKNAKSIYRMNLSKFQKYEQIENFVKHYKSVASDLVLLLLQTLRTVPDAGRFHEELERFTEMQKQHFSTFQNRMAFWSDTAGALGLLGTVWGMFVTFFKGDMDQQAILSGMGIALITTLMGLVISVILNFFSTEISGFFNKTLTQCSQVTEKLHSWVLKNQTVLQAVAVRRSEISSQGFTSRIEPSIVSEPMTKQNPIMKQEKRHVLYELSEISGNGQKVFVNQRIKSPLVVELSQIKEGRKRKVTGESVIFSIPDGKGKFENGKDEIMIKTNTSGCAKVYFTPEKADGVCRIDVRHPSLNVRPVYFDIEIVSPEPADIRIKGGNNQSCPSGKKLPKPLVVEVVDRANNPVPSCIVKLEIEMGDGFFQNKESIIQIPTDRNGLAYAELTLGKEDGFNAVGAEVPTLSGKRVSFQALGQ